MIRYNKRVPRYVPAWAEALGVRLPEEMQFVFLEGGRYVFCPPQPDALEKIIAEAKRNQVAEQGPVGDVAEQGRQSEKTVEMPTLRDQDLTPEIEPTRSQSSSGSSGSGTQNNSHSGQSAPKQSQANSHSGGSAASAQAQAHRQTRNGNPHLLVDLDSMPTWPPNLQVRRHRPDGKFYWNPSKVRLFRHPKQAGQGVLGIRLKKELRSRRLFNANLLRWLLKNTHQIPVSWRKNGRKIFFWDTIYETQTGEACILYLTSMRLRWAVGRQKLNEVFTSNDFAAVWC